MAKRTILFVDGNQNIIDGIQRQLRPYRQQWDLFFANDAQQALQIMQEQAIDLIVSEMIMPGMRGDELLKIVSDKYPGTVRMVLSGHCDEATLKSGLEVAHQYLSKPCNADVLREAISQVFKIQACVKSPRIIESVGDPNQLPSLPKIYQELNAAMADENISAQEIAKIFARDMVLSAKLLQLINSPYFGLHRVISSLTEAINLIGIKKLHSLVLSVHVKTAFPIANPQMARSMDYLWQDAARVSELAKRIAILENQQEDRPDQAYLGGLLHNMGLLIFMSRYDAKMKVLIEQMENTDTLLDTLETQIFGFTRFEVGAYVLSLWKIPPRIIEAILLQNTPSETDYDGMNALTAVHVAGCLLKPALSSGYGRLFEMQMDRAYLERINLLDRLSDWQDLADKVLLNFAGK